jgi:hypothetical protein
MTEAEHDRIYGTNDFSRMSVYAWDFCTKWRALSKIASVRKKNEVFENAMATTRIAYKIKGDLAQTVPAILKDPYFAYLDRFYSIFFKNLPGIDFSEKDLRTFVDKTDHFIFEYGTPRDLKNGPSES